jgi:hypothetical protein
VCKKFVGDHYCNLQQFKSGPYTTSIFHSDATSIFHSDASFFHFRIEIFRLISHDTYSRGIKLIVALWPQNLLTETTRLLSGVVTTLMMMDNKTGNIYP